MSKRILILTAGSRGDVQPYIALGLGLKHAGFEVTLATDRSFASFVMSHGLDFAPIHAAFVQLIQTDEGKAAFAGKKSFSLMQKVMPSSSLQFLIFRVSCEQVSKELSRSTAFTWERDLDNS